MCPSGTRFVVLVDRGAEPCGRLCTLPCMSAKISRGTDDGWCFSLQGLGRLSDWTDVVRHWHVFGVQFLIFSSYRTWMLCLWDVGRLGLEERVVVQPSRFADFRLSFCSAVLSLSRELGFLSAISMIGPYLIAS